MILFSNALAETAELDAALEGLTTQEAAAGGAIVGIAVGPVHRHSRRLVYLA